MFSRSFLSVIFLLSPPAVSVVLPLNSDLLDSSNTPDTNRFSTLLTSPKLLSDDTPQTLASLNLASLVSKNTIALTRISGSSNLTTSSTHLLRRATNPNGGTTLLRSTGSSFLAPITVGGQTFNVIVDTGSSDTWVVNSAFTCVDQITNQTVSKDTCRFGGCYDMSKEGSSSGDKFKKVDNVNFNVTYGDGEYLTGNFGIVDVSIADIKVTDQWVALATLAAWQGDGVASGLLGLAFPALTGSYAGSDPRMDRYCRSGQAPSTLNGGCNQVEYDPLLTNAFFDSQVVTPVFGLALSRDESRSKKGGYLSIGGIPDLDMVNAEGGKNAQFASADLRTIKSDDRYRYYLINVDGVAVGPAGSESSGTGGSGGQSGGSGMMRRDVAGWRRRTSRIRSSTSTTKTTSRTSTTTSTTTKPQIKTSSSITTTSTSTSTTSTSIPSSQATILASSQNTSFILDSGTTLSYLPPAQTRQILSLFTPPGTYDSSTGFWMVSCLATAPAVGIKLGGRIFYFNSKDLTKRYDTTRCISGIQDADGGLEKLGTGILGDTWLDSVLAVFDFRGVGASRTGGGVVRVAARREYVS